MMPAFSIARNSGLAASSLTGSRHLGLECTGGPEVVIVCFTPALVLSLQSP